MLYIEIYKLLNGLNWLNWTLQANFREIICEIHAFHEMHFKVSLRNGGHFFLGLSVLKIDQHNELKVF